MKQISAALKNHIDGDLTTLATCWVLTRRDGVRQAFTTHDREMSFDHLTFRPVNSFLPTAVSSSNEFNVDNLEVSALLSADGISATDIRAGRYDHARINIFQVNWQAPEMGRLAVRSGWLGEFTLKAGHFTVEIRGLAQKLQQTVGGVFSPECRADLGGETCHADLARVSVLGRVTQAPARDRFIDSMRGEAAGWFDYGVVRWISGANAGGKAEVRQFAAGEFFLHDRMPAPPAVGDIYLAVAGCDKRAATCKGKFQNFRNFQAETAIPGMGSLYNYPGLK